MAKKIPPTRYPFSIEQQYAKDIIKLIDMSEKLVMTNYRVSIKSAIERYREDVDELSIIQKILKIIKELVMAIFSPTKLLDIANRFVNNLNKFNEKNIYDQSVVMSVQLLQNNPKINDFVKSSIEQNVKYIKSIEETMLDKVSTVIFEETKKGTASKVIQEQLMKEFGVSRRKAEFLAVDQSGSMFGQLTKERHTSMGVSRFTWSDSSDSRVRPEHRNYNGKTYDYTNGANGKFPGSDYRCRCIGMPVF